MNKDTREINPYSGAFILEQLQRFGPDMMNRKHEVSFWLYFPNESSAQQAALRGESTGLQAEFSPPQKDYSGSQWLCLLCYPHVPDESLLDGISNFCMELATEFGGEYDGWEASLEIGKEKKSGLLHDIAAGRAKPQTTPNNPSARELVC